MKHTSYMELMSFVELMARMNLAHRCLSSFFVVCCCSSSEEITGLRAQLLAMSGEPDMNNPDMIEIQRAAVERFRKPGGVRLFDRREVKLTNLEKELIAKEQIVAQLLPEVARLRLECRLYSAQVALDKETRNELKGDGRGRTDRWKEENDRRQQAAIDRIRRDQEKLEKIQRLQQKVAGAASSSSSNLYAPSFSFPRFQQQAPASMMDDDAEEAEDDDDV